jgi:cytochrome b6-f complex iron-sulfur subunit
MKGRSIALKQSMSNNDLNGHDPMTVEAGESDAGSARLNRRSFLTWLTRGSLAAAALAALGQTLRFLAYEPPGAVSDVIALGLPSNFPPASLVYVADARVYVGRDRGGLWAMDAVCTHLGCLVQQGEEGGFVCPCHNSGFDSQGNALNGPATKPLRFLYLWLDEESTLTVDRSRSVEPSTRLRV